MTRSFAILAVIAAIAVLAITYVVSRPDPSADQFAQCRSGAIAGGADQIGGPFTLIDETGREVTDAEVLTKPSLIYFGYTFCPDVCPLDAVRNAEAVDLLAARGIEVQPVFISIDPARDTPEVMAEYTDYMHPDMLGLTGSEEQVRAASQAYRTYFKKQPAEDGDEEFYLVDHSTFSYLTLPGHGFVEFFRRETSAADLADKMACFVEKS